MWVFEEYVKEEDGKWVRPARGAKPPEGKTWVDEGYRPLTQVINELNENVIYLPGIPLPTSIHAQPDVEAAVTGAGPSGAPSLVVVVVSITVPSGCVTVVVVVLLVLAIAARPAPQRARGWPRGVGRPRANGDT